MSVRSLGAKAPALFVLGLALAALPGRAGNGHFLHGVGAVNSALGGAGVALPNDAIGSLNLNPALLARMDGSRFQFSLENADQQNAVESRIGPFSGRTEDEGDDAAIPAFAWTHHKAGSRVGYGMGFLGLAGFSVDYPQDPSNPLLAPQPRGFGRLYSSYQYMKIPTAVAIQVNDRLSLGASLNVARATLAGSPVGFAAPDCSSPTNCFFPTVEADSAYGYGLQLGVHFQANPAWAVGASYSTETRFEDFEWNSTVANPSLPTFGQARKIRFRIDTPATAAVGVAWTPSERLAVALDAKRIFYSSVRGFGDSGVDPRTGAIRGPGWQDIDVLALGAQFKASERVVLRAGYNKTDNPIPDVQTFFSLFAPGIFEDHATAGVGFGVTDALDLDLAYYRAFKNEGSGPLFSATGPVPGASVKHEMALSSFLLTLSFHLD